jgi:hypothetical protein
VYKKKGRSGNIAGRGDDIMVDSRSGDILDSLNEVAGVVNFTDPIGNKEYDAGELLVECIYQ